MGKKNCWEVMQCGRETGANKTGEQGACPAAVDERLSGVHGGKNGGRACWVLAGTLCGGKVQGTFASKFKNCEQCDFYKMVKAEEKGAFQLSIIIRARLNAVPAGVGR